MRTISSAPTVRTAPCARGLGLTFEGAAFEEQYMLGDVEVDWSMPRGYGVRAMHQTDGKTDDCSCASRCPAATATGCRCSFPTNCPPAPSDGVAHGFEGERKPRAAPYPGSTGPDVARADDCAKPAVVLGVSDQPPHRQRIWPGSGIRRRRRGPHPPPDRRAGHEHRHSGRAQPGLEVGARGVGARRARACSTATTPNGGPSARRSSAELCAALARASGRIRPSLDFIIRREAQLLIDYAGSPIVSAGAGTRAPDATG